VLCSCRRFSAGQDVTREDAARSPALYAQGIARGYYTHRTFLIWMLDATWLALVSLGVPILALSTQPAGGPAT
jgi:hypothetical protein